MWIFWGCTTCSAQPYSSTLCFENCNNSYIQIELANIPNEVEHRLIEREIEVHSEIDHPNIIKLWDTLAKDKTLYLVLEYAQKGNLFYFQNTKYKFSEC